MRKKRLTSRVDKTIYFNYCAVLLALAAVGITISFTGMYSDDYYYATFMRDGFAAFCKKTMIHYQTMNGRAVVHFLDELVLAVGTPLYAILGPLMLLACFWMGTGFLNSRDNRRQRAYAILIFALLVPCIPISILRETLYWVTGSMNYLFPTMMVIVAIFLQFQQIHSGKIRWYAPLLAFLCGATTEQGGAAAFAATCMLAVANCVKTRSAQGRKGLLLPLWVLLGYLTVILSPGTFTRASYENQTLLGPAAVANQLLQNLNTISQTILGENGLAFLLVTVCLLCAVLPFTRAGRGLTKWLTIGLVPAVLVTLSRLYSSIFFKAATLIILCTACYFVFVIWIFLRSESWIDVACFLLAALVTQLVMVAAPGSYIRTLFPAALLFILCIARLGGGILFSLNRYFAPGIFILLTVYSAYFIINTAAGYRQNAAILRRNEASIQAFPRNGEIHISLDVEPPYCYSMFYEDGTFTQCFYQYYNLPEDALIYYESERLPQLFYRDTQLTWPCIPDNGRLYFPIQPLVSALGGELFWEDGNELTIRIQDKKILYYQYSEEIYVPDDTKPLVLDATDQLCYYYSKLYIDAELAEDLFDLRAVWQGQTVLLENG